MFSGWWPHRCSTQTCPRVRSPAPRSYCHICVPAGEEGGNRIKWYFYLHNAHIQIQLGQTEELFLLWIISRLVSVELVGPFVPFQCLQSLPLQIIENYWCKLVYGFHFIYFYLFSQPSDHSHTSAWPHYPPSRRQGSQGAGYGLT